MKKRGLWLSASFFLRVLVSREGEIHWYFISRSSSFFCDWSLFCLFLLSFSSFYSSIQVLNKDCEEKKETKGNRMKKKRDRSQGKKRDSDREKKVIWMLFYCKEPSSPSVILRLALTRNPFLTLSPSESSKWSEVWKEKEVVSFCKESWTNCFQRSFIHEKQGHEFSSNNKVKVKIIVGIVSGES